MLSGSALNAFTGVVSLFCGVTRESHYIPLYTVVHISLFRSLTHTHTQSVGIF